MKTILIILLIILGLLALYYGLSVIVEIKKHRDIDRIMIDKAVGYIMDYWDKAPAPKPREEKEIPAVDVSEGDEGELLSAPETLPDIDWDEMMALDERFDEVARFVVSEQTALRPVLQRKLGLGYQRAGRILDELEGAGIVGLENEEGERAVLIKDSEALEPILSEFAKLPRTHPNVLDEKDLKETFWESMAAEDNL